MRYDAPAPFRGLIWLAAAALGWALMVALVLHVPQVLAGLAVAALLVWRTGQRPVERAAGATPIRAREDVRALVVHSV